MYKIINNHNIYTKIRLETLNKEKIMKEKPSMESKMGPIYMVVVILTFVILGVAGAMRSEYDNYVNTMTTFEVSIPGEERIICDNYMIDGKSITLFIGTDEKVYQISDREDVKITKIIDEDCKSFKEFIIKDNVEWGETPQ